MSRLTFVVLTDPVEGMEDEFNDWYTNQHLADVLKLDGFLSAQRFRYVPKSADDTPLRRYLALYDVEMDDVPGTHRRLQSVAGTDAMPFTPALDRSQAIGWYYEPITERRTK